MNCLEFRRQLATEPRSESSAFLGHRDGCARCGEVHARAQVFEAGLERALAVPVPDGLADRVLLRQTTATRGERGWALGPRHWRMAAGLALALGAATLWTLTRPAQALPDLAVAHLAHEPYALSARASVATAQVRALFAERGAALSGDPGEVHYLNLCSLGRDPTVHMVVQRREGPVTVYVVLGRREPGRRVFEREGVKGRSVPVAQGTLMLVASDARGFDDLERRWTHALGMPVGEALGAP
jgi:hypothetical protein